MEEEVTTAPEDIPTTTSLEEEAGEPEVCPQSEGEDLLSRLRDSNRERAYWQKMHSKAKVREEKLKEEIAELKAKLRKREQQLFGTSTERGRKNTKDDPVKKPPKNGNKRGQQRGAKGHGRRTHSALPVEEEVHSLEEDDRRCPECGELYEDTGMTEDSEVVEVEVKAHRRKIKRCRYRRVCRCHGQPNTITAPPAVKLIPKGAYGISFWVLVLLDKFLFQRPAHRLLSFLRLTVGLDVSPGTIVGGLKRLLPLFEPLYTAILDKNAADTRWHADETRWMVFETIQGKQGHRWYLWVFRSETTVAFRLDPSRSSSVPKAHFGDQAKGILSVDRYSAYKTLLPNKRIILAFCWAHVRRDFLSLAKSWPELEDWGLEWVERIGWIYALNNKRLSVQDDPTAFDEADCALVDAIDAMKAARDAQLAEPKLHTACRKVLESLQRHWSGLIIFIAHPEVPMDNNAAERDLRNPVIGRKNFRGSGAVWSGKLLVMVMSLFQTLLLHNIDPRLWLLSYLEYCAELGGIVPDNAERWLPWNLNDAERHVLRPLLDEPHDTS